MDWVESLNEAVRHIERNLLDGVDGEAAARHVHLSRFYLDRAFAILTGLTIAEYIRARRLSLAGQELLAGRAKVIDLAYRYGYDTPESFTKAFTRFHGVSPAAARKPGAALRCQNPLTIKIKMEGATIMNYQIEKMEAFSVVGKVRAFRNDSAFREIPGFWDEYFGAGYHETVCPAYGVCFDPCDGGGTFDYLIGDNIESGAAAPEGFVKREIPAYTWARFSCAGPMPEALQRVNRQIYTEWLPGNPDYEMEGSVNIELYPEGDPNAADYHSEIWIPVRRKR